jgi:uncharacterized RDD family membrane protein YckC
MKEQNDFNEEEIIASLSKQTGFIQFYPGITERIKAALIDSVVIVVFILLISSVFSLFNDLPTQIRIITFVFIFLLYDPIFTSFLGGTLGHLFMGIRVKRDNNQEKNINFFKAIIRYIFKVSFGWISLITIGGNKKRMAIHDLVVKSIVIYKKRIK